MGEAEQSRRDWPEAIAEVTECRYDARAGRALAFGLTSKEHFRITYNYRAGDELHTGTCFSEKARAQGSLLPIHYDPDLPHLSHFSDGGPQRVSLLFIAVVGLLAILLVLLLVLRGC